MKILIFVQVLAVFARSLVSMRSSRARGGRVPEHLGKCLPVYYIYRQKENLPDSPNHLKYRKIISISRFYEHSSRNSRNLGHFWKFEKISNSWNINISYIILKRVIWRFQIYNLFREDKSNNVFREVLKCFHRTAKFEFLAKQIIYLVSPDHPLQNYIRC